MGLGLALVLLLELGVAKALPKGGLRTFVLMVGPLLYAAALMLGAMGLWKERRWLRWAWAAVAFTLIPGMLIAVAWDLLARVAK